MRRAIVTYDPLRTAQWDLDAESHSIAYLMKRALGGQDYAKERGIMSIELEPEVAITLPLAWVEKLMAMASDPRDYAERRVVEGVAKEIGDVRDLAGL